jgi:hypothetical protein
MAQENRKKSRWFLWITKRIISRKDKEKYLVRYTILNTKWWSLKIHNILLSDDDCMHDHPWKFYSLILWGGYVEHSENGAKIYHPGNFLVRPAEFKHRLQIFQPCWTLVITFKKTRNWGFWTPRGFVHHKDYVSQEMCE